MAEPQPLFTFDHPNLHSQIDNSRFKVGQHYSTVDIRVFPYTYTYTYFRLEKLWTSYARKIKSAKDFFLRGNFGKISRSSKVQKITSSDLKKNSFFANNNSDDIIFFNFTRVEFLPHDSKIAARKKVTE